MKSVWLNEFQPWNHNCSSSLCTEWPPHLNDSLHAAAFFHCLVLPSDCLIMKAICRGSRWSEHESLGASRTAICHALTLHNELPLDLSRKWWRIILSIRNLPEWSQISHLCIVQRSVIFWAFGHPTTAKTKCTWLARHDKTTNKWITQVLEPSTIGTDKRVFPLTKILWLWNNIPQRKCTHF